MGGLGDVRRKVHRSTKEEQTATVLLDLTRLSVWLQYYYDIYLIDGRRGERGAKEVKGSEG